MRRVPFHDNVFQYPYRPSFFSFPSRQAPLSSSKAFYRWVIIKGGKGAWRLDLRILELPPISPLLFSLQTERIPFPLSFSRRLLTPLPPRLVSLRPPPQSIQYQRSYSSSLTGATRFTPSSPLALLRSFLLLFYVIRWVDCGSRGFGRGVEGWWRWPLVGAGA